MIYLFVLDDSLTSYRLTTRTEELTKFSEPIQKLRVRLWPCKIDLSPITDRFKAMLLWWFLVFYVLVLNFCAVSTLCMFSYFKSSLGG